MHRVACRVRGPSPMRQPWPAILWLWAGARSRTSPLAKRQSELSRRTPHLNRLTFLTSGVDSHRAKAFQETHQLWAQRPNDRPASRPVGLGASRNPSFPSRRPGASRTRASRAVRSGCTPWSARGRCRPGCTATAVKGSTWSLGTESRHSSRRVRSMRAVEAPFPWRGGTAPIRISTRRSQPSTPSRAARCWVARGTARQR